MDDFDYFNIRLEAIPEKSGFWAAMVPLRNDKIIDAPSGFDVKSNIKNPPSQKEIENGALYIRLTPAQARKRVEHNLNYGIYAIRGGLCFIDIDTKNGKLRISDDQIYELIKSFGTFVVKTRNGGYHFYFINDDIRGNGLLYVNGQKIGELRKDWMYVVGPGSFYPKDDDAAPGATGRYSIFKNQPIKPFSQVVFPDWLTVKEASEQPEIKELEKPTVKKEIYENEFGIPLSKIIERDKKLNSLLHESLVKGVTDRSEIDASIVRKLYWYRFSHQDIAGILQYYRPYEKTERDDYIQRTIQNCATGNQMEPKKFKQPVKKPKEEPAEEIIPATQEEHIVEASRILKDENPLEFLLSVFHEDHVSDDVPAQCIIFSLVSDSVENSDGLHTMITGGTGDGKTHVASTIIKQLPAKYQIPGSISNKYLYYKKLTHAVAIVVDDKELNTEMLSLIKNSTSHFKEGCRHGTVINNEGKDLEMPRGCVWIALKKEAGGMDEQVWSRFLNPYVDNSDETTVVVSKKKLLSASLPPEKKISKLPIATAIWEILKSERYWVVIPFATEIQINMSKTRRDTDLFVALIMAVARLYYMQRKIEERNGFKILYATVDDFNIAKNIYTTICGTGGGQSTDLMQTESELLDFLLLTKTTEFTIPGLIKMLVDYKEQIPNDPKLRKIVDRLYKMSDQTFRNTLNGRNSKEGPAYEGLTKKVPRLISKQETERVNITASGEHSIATHATKYKIHDINALELWKNGISITLNSPENNSNIQT